jgi:hypothetical protein
MYSSEEEYPAAGYDRNPPQDAIVGKWTCRVSYAGETFQTGLIIHEDGTGLEVMPQYESDAAKAWTYQGSGMWAVYSPGDEALGMIYRVSHPSATGERTLYDVGSLPVDERNHCSIKFTKME